MDGMKGRKKETGNQKKKKNEDEELSFSGC